MKSPSLYSNAKSLSRHEARENVCPAWRTATNFQTQLDDVAVAPETRPTTRRVDLAAFRRLSADYLNHESSREYFLELIVLGLISAIAAWPIVSALRLLAEIARG